MKIGLMGPEFDRITSLITNGEKGKLPNSQLITT
jgi:hypothetical protein